jgi:hypothetical protein
MDGSHLGADQALDMTTVMWRAGRSPFHTDPMLPAAPQKGAAVELRPIVNEQGSRQAGCRPSDVDIPLCQSCRFVEDGMEQA